MLKYFQLPLAILWNFEKLMEEKFGEKNNLHSLF